MNGNEVGSGKEDSVIEGLTNKERLILDMISKGEFGTIKSVSETLSVSHNSIERALKSLASKNLIERIGSDRKGYWVKK